MGFWYENKKIKICNLKFEIFFFFLKKGDFMCRLAPFYQATNVFVSTMSITAIALDRYCICFFFFKNDL